MPIVLNENQMQWLEAQGYSLKKKTDEGRTIKSDKEDSQSKDEAQKEAEYVGGEVVYEGIREALDDALSLDDLPEFFINEKAHLNFSKNKN